MYIASKVVGPVQTNCYLLGDEETKTAALIDPGDRGRELVRWSEEQGYQIVMILLTHGHFDHIGGVKAAQDALAKKGVAVPVYVHRADYPLAPCGFLDQINLSEVEDVRFYDEGSVVELAGHSIAVRHTPGHTKGGVCLIVEDKLFSGDTLFCGSCGRTDFPGSSSAEMMASLGKLARLEENYNVYPGHEQITTLENERRYNPYMRYAMEKM